MVLVAEKFRLSLSIGIGICNMILMSNERHIFTGLEFCLNPNDTP